MIIKYDHIIKEKERSCFHSLIVKIKNKSKELENHLTVITSMVETIIGGFVGGGKSMNSRKRHSHLVITISERKLKRRSNPMISFLEKGLYSKFDRKHDDQMVIIVTIHNYVVKKIFANQGS